MVEYKSIEFNMKRELVLAQNADYLKALNEQMFS